MTNKTGTLWAVLNDEADIEHDSTEVDVPRRGTPTYQQALDGLASLSDTELVTVSLITLWEEYGWRAVVDTMTRWITQLHHAPAAQLAGMRDMFGAFRLEEVLGHSFDAEQALRFAAKEASGHPTSDWDHETFASAMQIHESAHATYEAWRATFQAALRACARDEPHLVRTELARHPDVKDRGACLRAAVALHTATYVIQQLA